jgi:AcrR family transcriptional regulator
MTTRERIIDAAVRLFNESGAGAISTNHIAAAARISPGNLYYHFHNKEEIIRAIFGRMSIAWNGANTLPADRPPTLADLDQLVRANFAVLRDYRFFYREPLALFQRDPTLREQYGTVRRRGLADTELLLQHYVAAGVLRAPDAPEVVPHLALACWLIVENWLPFAELGGESIGPAQLRGGVDLLIHILRPYLTAGALAELARETAVANPQEEDR